MGWINHSIMTPSPFNIYLHLLHSLLFTFFSEHPFLSRIKVYKTNQSFKMTGESLRNVMTCLKERLEEKVGFSKGRLLNQSEHS